MLLAFSGGSKPRPTVNLQLSSPNSIQYETDSPGQSRGIKPKGLTVRKVRASGERITDNVRRW